MSFKYKNGLQSVNVQTVLHNTIVFVNSAPEALCWTRMNAMALNMSFAASVINFTHLN